MHPQNCNRAFPDCELKQTVTKLAIYNRIILQAAKTIRAFVCIKAVTLWNEYVKFRRDCCALKRE